MSLDTGWTKISIEAYFIFKFFILFLGLYKASSTAAVGNDRDLKASSTAQSSPLVLNKPPIVKKEGR